MYYGFSTVILVSRLFISWISDAIFFVGFARGFVLFGWLSAFRGVRSVAVCDGRLFVFRVGYRSITAVYEADSSPMPSLWLFAGVVTFAVG